MANSLDDFSQSIPRATYAMKSQSVTPLKERRPRVIVEVSETDLKAAGEHACHVKALDRTPIAVGTPRLSCETKIDILNSSSLVFQMKSQSPQDYCRRILNFDCVANGNTDQLIRWQMSSLVDKLLITGRNNCCLLRIGPQRTAPTLQILSHILIPEINKRLSSPEMSPLLLYAIRVEYYDVRKYDVVNMVLRAAPKSKPRHHITLRNTWELLHWVQETYPSLWALGAGHECIDLKFIFVRDRSGMKVRIKLSIVHFFLNKMDGDMAAGLRNFLENSGANNSARIKHSILTDYLREYFFSPDNWHIWMVFKVPGSKNNGIVNEMLTLASSAYAGVQSLIDGKLRADTSVFKKHDLEMDFLCPVINFTQSVTDNKCCTPVRSCASNTAAQVALKFRKKEKQSLSYWYRQMDEKFLNVLLTMEVYYARKTKSNKSELGGDLKSGTKLKDRREFISTVRSTPKTSQNPDAGLQLLASNYKQAVSALHTLIQQIERSPFARQLRVLIQMKNNELVQHLTNLRDKTTISPKPKGVSKIDTPTAMKAKNVSSK